MPERFNPDIDCAAAVTDPVRIVRFCDGSLVAAVRSWKPDRRVGDVPSVSGHRSRSMEIDMRVFWPDGRHEHRRFDPRQLDSRGIGNAKNLLAALSLTGTLMRASTATGRLQGLTVVYPPSPANGDKTRVVRIEHESKPVVLVAGSRDQIDFSPIRAILLTQVDSNQPQRQAIESFLDKRAASAVGGQVLIAVFGTSEDPAVDEAYGLAIHLGVAMAAAHQPM
jgi:hypothetical protein